MRGWRPWVSERAGGVQDAGAYRLAPRTPVLTHTCAGARRCMQPQQQSLEHPPAADTTTPRPPSYVDVRNVGLPAARLPQLPPLRGARARTPVPAATPLASPPRQQHAAQWCWHPAAAGTWQQHQQHHQLQQQAWAGQGGLWRAGYCQWGQ